MNAQAKDKSPAQPRLPAPPRGSEPQPATTVSLAAFHVVTTSPRAWMTDMQVIVRRQDRGALRLDHLHDQALCEPEGRGDL
jgi:hypothetical protein